MARATFQKLTCDRCKRSDEIHDPQKGDSWGAIHAAQSNGPIRIGTIPSNKLFPEQAKDLCPNCITDLQRWWDEGTANG